MQSSNSRPARMLGYVLLVLAFVAAGFVFAGAGFRAWSEEGFSMAAVMATLAVLGTISLTQRYLRVALELKRERARRR